MGSIGNYSMPFGKYKGRTLDEVAETDEGLLYLDWASGAMDGRVKEAITEYLSDPTIRKELNVLLDE